MEDQVTLTPFGFSTVPGKTMTPLGLLTGRRYYVHLTGTHAVVAKYRVAMMGQWEVFGNRQHVHAILGFDVNGYRGPLSRLGKPPGAWEGQGTNQGGSPWRTRRGFT